MPKDSRIEIYQANLDGNFVPNDRKMAIFSLFHLKWSLRRLDAQTSNSFCYGRFFRSAKVCLSSISLGWCNILIVPSSQAEDEALMQTAQLMLVSARTAPKSGGKDDILTAIVTEPEKSQIADMMDEIASERGIAGFKRDADNVRNSAVVLLVGARTSKSFGLNCGSCGYPNCREFEEAGKRLGNDFFGPSCIFKSLDLGIALGSAVKTASILNVDNRIMYRIGVAAMRLKLMPEADVIIGIPISSRGKSIYYDRPSITLTSK
jgi:uncharacterized ferredoxin-like protein